MYRYFILILFTISVLYTGEDSEIKSSYYASFQYEKTEQYRKAIEVLDPLLKKYPKGYTLHLRVAWLNYLDYNFQDALAYYERATLLSPYSLDARLGLTRVYLDTYAYQKAQTIAFEILKIDYYNYYANLYAIKALTAQKKYSIAIQITHKMLALYPTDISFLELLAKLYEQTDHTSYPMILEDLAILDPENA